MAGAGNPPGLQPNKVQLAARQATGEAVFPRDSIQTHKIEWQTAGAIVVIL